MKAKTLLSVFTAGMILLSCHDYTQSQNNSSDKQILAMLKDFYTSYITQIAKGTAGPVGQQKIDSLQQKYCTEALLKQIPNLIEQTESDPFIKGQDSNIEYLKTLSVTKDFKNKNGYIVSYIDNFINPNKEIKEQVIIHLTVVKEKDSFKIDSVW